jgi:hypothetical protein
MESLRVKGISCARYQSIATRAAFIQKAAINANNPDRKLGREIPNPIRARPILSTDSNEFL